MQFKPFHDPKYCLMGNEPKNFFDTSHLREDLKSITLNSGVITLVSQGVSLFIQIGTTMVLARLLTPEDYGMIAMVGAVTAFAKIFSDLGLSTATVQCAIIDHHQVNDLFWINVFVGVLLSLIVAAISPFIAWFYKTPELFWLAMVMSVNFIIVGFGIQHNALLVRQMRFLSIAKVQILSMCCGTFVAVIMARCGFRYWALAFSGIVSSTVVVVGAWFVSGWRPGRPKYNKEARAMLNFGIDVTGFNIVNYFSRNLDNILIGRFLGSSILGVYSKAYQLLMLPISNIRQPLTGR